MEETGEALYDEVLKIRDWFGCRLVMACTLSDHAFLN